MVLFFCPLWEGSTACGLLMSSVCSETICPWMASLTTIRLDYVIDQLGCTLGTEYRKCPSSVISVCCPSVLSVKSLFMSPLCFLADDPEVFLELSVSPQCCREIERALILTLVIGQTWPSTGVQEVALVRLIIILVWTAGSMWRPAVVLGLICTGIWQ